MKYCFFVAFVSLMVWACTGNKALTIRETESEQDDSVSYELIVLDPGFESWFLFRSKPANFRSQAYYENWNQRYVNAWNYEKIGHRYASVIQGNIDYEPGVDYGLEINHKLFYYFLYVENELGIQLIPDGPKSF